MLLPFTVATQASFFRKGEGIMLKEVKRVKE